MPKNLGHIFCVTMSCALSACGNPYALSSSSINYDRPQSPGSIMVTDPKLYKREALINERRDEVEYLDQLLKDSKTTTFTPEIVRELEVVSALSASLGLKFDPAAGANYRRAQETSDIQQEIQTMKLQMELAQLKHDYELFLAAFAKQTSPLNPDLGKPVTSSVSPLSSDVTAPAVKDLSGLITALQARLDADAKHAMPASGVAINPIDTFRDRAAYRSLLNSAKNAVSLDELHDHNGSALVRLYFSATVLPPAKADVETLGVLRMEVVPPEWDKPALLEVYRNWIDHLNRNFNLDCPVKSCSAAALTANTSGLEPSNMSSKKSVGKALKATAAAMATTPLASKFYTNPSLVGLASTGDLFDLVYYYYDKKDNGSCPGVGFDEIKETDDCGVLVFAAAQADTSGVMNADPEPLRDSFSNIISNRPDYIEFARKSRDQLNSLELREAQVESKVIFDDKCRIRTDKILDDATSIGGGLTLRHTLGWALRVYHLSRTTTEIDLQAQRFLKQHAAVQIRRSRAMNVINYANSDAMALFRALETFGMETAGKDAFGQAGKGCHFSPDEYVPPKIPFRFVSALNDNEGRVAIYEVGPREQVQQMSTTARAAEAIGLAAAIAGQIPSSGLGADSNIGYSRSATGKADMLERMPLVISFAEAKSTNSNAIGRSVRYDDGQRAAFGWLLGPRVSLNPKKRALELSQQLKPYDLSVDLAVPGWWPYLGLQTQTAWAPNWRSGNGRTIIPDDMPKLSKDRFDPKDERSAHRIQEKTIRVNLAPNSSDMWALTSRVAGIANTRFVSIDKVWPKILSVCSTSMQVQVIGENVWRSNLVIIGDQKFDGDKIRVLPDMTGVLVNVDGTTLRNQPNTITPIYALTPYGQQSDTVTLTDMDKAPKCEKAAATEEASKKAPTIKSVDLAVSVCAPTAVFNVKGMNLSGYTEATLGELKGAVTEADPKNGTLVKVRFAGHDLQSNFIGIGAADLTIGKATKSVKLDIPETCPAAGES